MITHKKILIIGGAGQLGQAFARILARENIPYDAPGEEACDLTDTASLRARLTASNPDVVLNCAAYNAVDLAEDGAHKEKALLINHTAVQQLADICADQQCTLVHFSTDYVFDGTKGSLYTEDDPCHPLNVYGRSKWLGEQAVLTRHARNLVFRLSWLIGPGQQNFLYKLDQWATKNPVLKIADDEVSVPTFTSTVTDVVLKALAQNLTGLYHLTNSGSASRYALAKQYLELMNKTNTIVPVPVATFHTTAARPGVSAMSNDKLSKALNITIPHWTTELHAYCKKAAEIPITII